MFRRQLFKRVAQPLIEFAARSLLEGIPSLAWHSADFIFRILAAQHGVTAFATAKIDRKVGGDAVKPGREAGARFELGKILISADKGLLGQFERIFLIVDYGLRHVDHAP